MSYELPPRFYDAFGPVVETEDTQFTARAHEDFRGAAGETFTYADFGAELRAFNHQTGVTFTVVGQTPSHGKQGCNPERITGLREHLSPTLFLALQGPTGWGAWLIPGHEPFIVPLYRSGDPKMKRYGYWCREMLLLTLDPTDEKRELLRPDATAPAPVDDGRLFVV